MKPIKIFLITREPDNEWNIRVFFDFDEMLDLLNAKFNTSNCLAVMHIGFEKPDRALLNCIKAYFLVGLIATKETIVHLADEVKFFKIEIFEQCFYLVKNGWSNYYKYEEKNCRSSLVENVENIEKKDRPIQDWLLFLKDLDTELLEKLQLDSIYSEIDYLENEWRLAQPVRRKAGVYRMNILSGSVISSENIISNLQFAPPWLLVKATSDCDFSNRIMNSFKSNNISTIFDIVTYGEGIAELRSFGKKSFAELKHQLFYMLTEEAIEASGKLNITGFSSRTSGIQLNQLSDNDANSVKVFDIAKATIEEIIVKAFEGLTEREIEIIKLRSGIGTNALTLLDVGKKFGVSRERIRQIEKKAMEKCGIFKKWLEIAIEDIHTLLNERREVLYLESLAVENKRFVNCEKYQQFIEYMIRYYEEETINIIEIDGLQIISKIDMTQYEYFRSSVIRDIRAAIGEGINIAYAKDILDVTIPDKYSDVSEVLWDSIKKESIVKRKVDGSEILVALKNDLSDYVLSTLQESDVPLHYKEITKKISKSKNVNANERRVHAIAASLALLFERGTYGLKKHLGLTDSEIKNVSRAAEDIICSSNRQWHCTELAEEIGESSRLPNVKINAHIVDISLKLCCSEVNDLGRLVWQSKNSNGDGNQSRIDIHQAIVSILQNNKGPMSYDEIVEKLQIDRGVSAHIQLFNRNPLVKIDDLKWGLINRDLPIDSNDILHITENVVLKLNQMGVGIHLTEIYSKCIELKKYENAKVSPILISSLGSMNGLYKLDVGGYLYLPGWENSRRLSARNAIKIVLRESGGNGITFDTLKALVQDKMGRLLDSSVLSSCLNTLDEADYDSEKYLWKYQKATESGDDDDEDAI